MGIVEAHIISVPSHKVFTLWHFVLLIPVVAGELATPLHLGRHPSCCYYILQFMDGNDVAGSVTSGDEDPKLLAT